MKLTHRIVQFLLITLFCQQSFGQSQDTKTLSVSQLMEMVRRYHPVAKQADINIEKAKADITIARAGFDPYFYNTSAQKTFDGTDYYYYNRPQVTIPTWFGVEISGGREYLSGSRTNSEETLGETSYFGISVPLAKNLLMDKRRAALKTAKIFRDASATEKNNILNNLMLEALNTYWEWTGQYLLYNIVTNAVKVNEQRLQLVRIAYRQGDRPAIDTTEALTQLQSFQLMQSQLWLAFQNTGLELSTYLWTPEDLPYTLPADVLPDQEARALNTSGLLFPELNQLLDAARRNHPELLQYNFKLDALAIEKKLKFQDLLPTVNFRYNQLGKGYDILKTATGPLFENNYQYGLNIGIPLRFSQGRGEYRKAKLKITETRLQQNLKQLQIENKVRNYYNELTALQFQINLQEKAYQNFLVLQRGEETRFLNGESSLFLVNSRENKSLEALQKLTELKAKYFKAINYLQWAAGNLR
ncbi:MAG TPA: TolC family protein [Chitinophagaceae bacterium]|nr:TolC family protein [Chitinophagaceae bacterium]